jgi:acyl-CoA reductase-like NAD-dependent aldehyde dehydrogenase
VIKEENSATDEEVELALERAQKAQKEWAKSTLEERAALLYDFLDWVVNNQEEICSLSVQDTGKTSTYRACYLT